MYLLQGQSLTPAAWFMPESMPAQLVDSGISTASIVLGPDAPDVTVGAWLLDDQAKHPALKGLVWRVKSVETNFTAGTRTLQLEHMIALLQDDILFGERKTKDISGKSTATARQAAEYALKGQSIWALGDCEYDRALPYSFNNVTRYNALTTVCGTLKDWCWEYDLSRLPFRLHIRQKSSEMGCELRMGRNLSAIKMTLDRSQMYTRFYPVGARNKTLPEKYLEKNTEAYGVVAHTATDQSQSNDAMMRAWAEEMLEKHAEPELNLTITALDLSAASEEPLDNIRLGMICRVPLPEFGTVIRQRVSRMQWRDALADPESISVTLANAITDVATILKQMGGGASSNAGGSAKAQEEDHAWLVDTTDHVGMVAEAIIGKEGETVDWSRVASIIVDGEGIHQRVVKAQADIIVNTTAIEMNEKRIQLEATARSEADEALSAQITVEAGRITSVVNKTGVNSLGQNETLYSKITQNASAISSEVTRATGAEDTLSSRITQNADRIALVVTQKDGRDVVDAASIVLGINDQTGSFVKIAASTVELSGYVTMSDLSATNAVIENLVTGRTTATQLKAQTLGVTSTFILGGYRGSWQSHNFVTKCEITMPSLTLTGSAHSFLYSSGGTNLTPSGSNSGRLVSSYSAGSVSVNQATLYVLERGSED